MQLKLYDLYVYVYFISNPMEFLYTFESRTCYQVIKDKWFSVILKSLINDFSTLLSKDRKISLSLMNNVENLDF